MDGATLGFRLGLGVRVWGFRVGEFSMAVGPRGRLGGGCPSGGGVWVEWWVMTALPTGVVVEAGWARLAGGEGLMTRSS